MPTPDDPPSPAVPADKPRKPWHLLIVVPLAGYGVWGLFSGHVFWVGRHNVSDEWGAAARTLAAAYLAAAAQIYFAGRLQVETDGRRKSKIELWLRCSLAIFIGGLAASLLIHIHSSWHR